MRRPALITSLLLGLVFATAAYGESSPAVFRISGVVQNRVDASPVARCHIVATPALRGASRRFESAEIGADTDDHGHFSINVPAAGSWSLRASARGYRPQLFDQHEEFSSAVVLSNSAPTIDLIYRLTPDSTIEGFVLDEANEPVRRAQVSLHAVLPASPDVPQPLRTRANATTDDRGHYELAELAPGEYRISVQAQPWYAAQTQPRSGLSTPTGSPDPSLDVVYPLTWFPGGTDPDTAATIKLSGGETRRADFQLQPIPAVHLRITNNRSGQSTADGPVRFPQVQPVTAGSAFSSVSMTVNSQGQIDVGGLSPGWYRVQYPAEQGQPGRTALIQVTPGSGRSLDPGGDTTTSTVTVKIDGTSNLESSSVTFVDAEHPQNIFRTNSGFRGGGLQRRQAVSMQSDPATRSLELPPGRYLVYQSAPDTFVTGIALNGKEVPGRLVVIPAGESSVTLHLATGRASIKGIATFAGKPVVGAMVLLVPVTVEQPGSMTQVRRDQTNTDGSFDIDGVIPGQYILVAIDRGWEVHWNDPATLRRYLIQGVPLDLQPAAKVSQHVDAQAP